MSTLEEQFAAEEAWMVEEEAQFARRKAELARLQKEAQEEVKWKAEEEQRRKEEEVWVEEEWKWKEEEEEKRRADEERKWNEEVEERKRVEREIKWKEEEEHRKRVDLDKQKQSEANDRWEIIIVEEDPVDEAERKRWAEARIHEQRVDDQMVRAAQAESSKQATQEFAQAALAYQRSQGTARFNWPYVDVGPIGTNRHVSAPVLSAGHLLMVCRIVCLAFLVNSGGRPVSGYPVAGFVPHVPSRKFGACGWIFLSDRSRRVKYLSM